jgi:hypothetical protein
MCSSKCTPLHNSMGDDFKSSRTNELSIKLVIGTWACNSQ